MSLRARMGVAALAILTTVSVAVGGAGVANASAGAPYASGDRNAAGYTEFVDWYAYSSTTPNWTCSLTFDTADFYEQVCVIVNGKSFQGALIFVPKKSDYYSAQVWNVRMGSSEASRVCAGRLTAWVRVVCFAPTQTGSRGESVYGLANDPNYKNLYGPVVRIS
ncbi:hypothetical protein ABTX15_32470 [Micromonospora sp. NPDC094482]|uniref:hypothetical protein n=1 Tax=unclassified Micromonospora TaxID=2617518 RepID=UPI00333398A5